MPYSNSYSDKNTNLDYLSDSVCSICDQKLLDTQIKEYCSLCTLCLDRMELEAKLESEFHQDPFRNSYL